MDFGLLRRRFDDWVGLPLPERDAHLQDLAAQDPAAAALLAQMFAADARSDDPLLQLGEDLFLPGRLGRFRVLRELGRGGMGVVLEGEQELPRRRVAIKGVVPGLHGPTIEAALRNEVQAMAALVHPAIPQIYEVFEVDGRPYVAMELVVGQPLLDALEQGADLTRRLAWVLGVAEALAHAHAHGVVHRDVKPANILVVGEQVKVVDWGIARVGPVDGPPGAGTYAYAAPEQLAGAPGDPRADVYSLGGLAVRVLLGLPPGDALPDTLPVELRAVLDHCRAPDPAARYADARGLAADLRAFRDRRPVSVLPRIVAVSVAGWRRHGRTLLRGAAVAAGIATVAAGGTWVWQVQRTEAREHAAAERLAAVLARPGISPESADFTGLVDDPLITPTAAWGQAWAWAAAHSDGDAALAAHALAWAGGAEPIDTLAAAVLERGDVDGWRALAGSADARGLLAGGDVEGAHALLQGREAAALAPLLRARPWPVAEVGALLPDGGAVGAIGDTLFVVDEAGHERRVGLSGRVRELHVAAGAAWVRVEGEETRILRVDLGSLEVVERFREAGPLGAFAVGEDEALLVTAPYPDRRGWRVAADGTSRRIASFDGALDVNAVASLGARFVVASGGWRNGGLRLLDAATGRVDAWLQMHAADVAALADGGFVVVGTPAAAGPFDDETPLLVTTDAQLGVLRTRSAGGRMTRIEAVDLGGDGLTELVGDGAAGLRIFVDDDPPLRLPGWRLVDVNEGGFWLTQGDRAFRTSATRGQPFPLRVVSQGQPAGPVSPAASGPLAERWARLESLLPAGLAEPVATGLLTLARGERGRVARDLLLRAHELVDPSDPQAAVPIARALLARADVSDRAALVQDLLDANAIPALAALDALPEALETPVRVPIAQAVTVMAPGVATLEGPGALRLRATGDRGELVSVPLEVGEAGLAVAIDLELVHFDWAGAVSIAVEGGGVRQEAVIRRLGGLDAAHQQLNVRCEPDSLRIGPVDAPTSTKLVLTWMSGRFGCALGDGAPILLDAPRVPVGAARLVIAAVPDTAGDRALVDLRVQGVEVRGAMVGSAVPGLALVPDAQGLARDAAGDDPLRAALASRAVGVPRLSDRDLAFLLRVDPVGWIGQARPSSALLLDAWGPAIGQGEADALLTLPGVAPTALRTTADAELAVEVARALLDGGARVAEAEALLDRLRPAVTEAWWLTARARALRGDIDGARDALAEWLRRAPAADIAAARARADATLAPLVPADLPVTTVLAPG